MCHNGDNCHGPTAISRVSRCFEFRKREPLLAALFIEILTFENWKKFLSQKKKKKERNEFVGEILISSWTTQKTDALVGVFRDIAKLRALIAGRRRTRLCPRASRSGEWRSGLPVHEIAYANDNYRVQAR